MGSLYDYDAASTLELSLTGGLEHVGERSACDRRHHRDAPADDLAVRLAGPKGRDEVTPGAEHREW